MKDKLVPKKDYVYELPKEGQMRVPGRIYSSQALLKHPGMDSAIQQVANVATLPGIVDFSMAMPDIHWGESMSEFNFGLLATIALAFASHFFLFLIDSPYKKAVGVSGTRHMSASLKE